MTDHRRPRGARRALGLAAGMAIALSACAGAASPSPSVAPSGAPSGAPSVAPSTAAPITLNTIWMKQAAYSEDDVNAMLKAFTDENPTITVNTEFVQYEALHDKIVTAQITGSGQYDLVLMDTPWPAEFADAQIVKDITDQVPADFKSGVFDSAWTAATYKDRIWGVPWINDTKFFFYNKKMLADAGVTGVPKTWDDVLAAAKAIKDKNLVKYPLVWSWTQAEAVICDWTELAGVMGGADFIDTSGAAKFNTGGGLAALQFMKKSIDDGLTNPASLGFVEDDVNKTIGAGQAAMGLNWTYGYNVLNDPATSSVAGDIGVAAAPGTASTPTAGVNGGMSIAVTTKSQHPDEALKLALWMASQPMQEKYDANTFPMWKTSFDKTDLTAKAPDFWAAADNAFGGLVARPIVPYYTKLSSALQVAIQEALKGSKTPQQALDEVAAKLPDLQQ
ncbi:MAG TPA: extracellular solute-binding protein [Candidatus Limnocylindrales bacterium]|nr:extracellular solute-binding protein [Candidatus Limnocylindrales bacterium]